MTPLDPELSPMVDDLIEVGRDLWTANLVTSHGGNLSVRWEQGACITQTGAMLGRLTPERFVTVNSHGVPTVSGTVPQPSSDTAIHLATFREVPEANAVVHAHPLHAIALSLEWGAILPPNLEGKLFIGRVPVLDVIWEESAEPIAEALREHVVVMTRAHGAYARGADTWEALKYVSILEEAATILYLSGQS